MRKTLLLLAMLISSISYCQEQLYKVSLVRAKPGELLSVIDLINDDITNYESYLDHQPYLLRHSQGDHWDLMLIYPIDQLNNYFSSGEISKRAKSKTLEKTYANSYFDLVSFQEEAIVKGPDLEKFNDACQKFELFHIEIFTALAGKQSELLEQRKAENVFYAGINHRPNFIFTRVFGPSWDNFTIGFYEDMHDFAGPQITFEDEDKSAKEAGFEGVNYIGSYLRSLIAEHHDTLAWKVD